MVLGFSTGTPGFRDIVRVRVVVGERIGTGRAGYKPIVMLFSSCPPRVCCLRPPSLACPNYTRYLLFLRHVQRIEVYTVNSTDTAPVLQYSVEVTKRDPPNGWLTVPAFVSGPVRRPLSKEVDIFWCWVEACGSLVSAAYNAPLFIDSAVSGGSEIFFRGVKLYAVIG